MENSDGPQPKWVPYVSYGCVALLVGFFLVGWLGNEVPGSFFEKWGDYNTQYWISVSSSSKPNASYWVRGQIIRSEGSHYLTAVYWSKGGTTSFDSCDIYDIIPQSSFWHGISDPSDKMPKGGPIDCLSEDGRDYNINKLGDKVD